MPEFDIAEFRKQVRSRSLLPYERLTGTPEAQAVGRAENILTEGWRLLNHPAVHLAGQLPWDEFSPASRSWNFHLNCWDPLDDLLAAHTFTSESKYFEAAVRTALDWIERHPSSESGGVHAWYDMAVGLRAYRLAYVLDVAARTEAVKDHEVGALYASLELHRVQLADDDKIAFHNNHGFYQVAGQLAMARRFGALAENMRASLVQAKSRLLPMLEQQFTEEGVHREHSPDYHRMVYETLKGIVDSHLIEDATILAKVGLIEQSLSWFVMPDGYIVNFGDSDYRLVSKNKRTAQAKWQTAEMRFVATQGQIGEAPATAIRAFEKSGYFVVRRMTANEKKLGPVQGSYLAQTAAFHSRTHKHADDLSFVWYDRGLSILVDAGRYGYVGKTETGSALWADGFWYDDPNRVYCESTRAHNTVEIDGRNYPRKQVKPYGSGIGRSGTAGEDVFYCESELRHFKSIRHVRLLVFQPQRWLLVLDWLYDNIEEAHDYHQWFHFAPELSVRQEDEQYVVPIARSAQPLRVGSLLRGAVPIKPVLGQEEPVRQGWWSPKHRIALPNYAVAFEQRGRTAVFATVFAFCSNLLTASGSRVAPSGRTGHLRWRSDEVNHAVTFSRPEEGTLTLEHHCS
jgi:hypothetical protein